MQRTYWDLNIEEREALMKSKTVSSKASTVIARSKKTTGIEITNISTECDWYHAVNTIASYTLLQESTVQDKLELGRIFKGGGLFQNASLSSQIMLNILTELESLGVTVIQVNVEP